MAKKKKEIVRGDNESAADYMDRLKASLKKK